jgi:radical SAM superfamily enzyme YgiQ (UPF0313 family)
MKTVLISPYTDAAGVGARSLSAYLKSRGHQTKLIFLPSGQIEHRLATDWSYQYDEKVLAQLVELCGGSALIGITLMTNYFDRVAQLTRRLKSDLDIPVIWGGIHATIRPEECLQYADLACFGEGEAALLDLVERIKNGEDYQYVENIWVKNNGNIIKNKMRPLISNLDTLPFPDYDLEDHFVLDKGIIKPMTESLLKKYLFYHSGRSKEKPVIAYTVMSSRGCPHHCAYCGNDVYLRLYAGEKFLRRRSPDKIVEEIELIRKRFDFIGYVEFQDDSFFAASQGEIEQFSKLYKEKIGLPFWCYGSPRTITEGKVKALIDAGLNHVTMGIQSGSSRTQKLYKRNIRKEVVMKTAKILNKYTDSMTPPSYDIILDNPYESLEDNLETLRLLVDVPRPYELRKFSLVFFPGTSLYERAKQDRLITDEKEQIYRKHVRHFQGSYVNFVFYLIGNNFPTFILNLLLNKKIVRCLNRKSLMGFFEAGYRLFQRVRIKKRRRLRRLDAARWE